MSIVAGGKVLCLISLVVAVTGHVSAGSATPLTSPGRQASAPSVFPTATVAVKALPGQGAAPFDQPHTLIVPTGWSAQVWSRVPDARLAAWAPDGALLVSQPSLGQITRLVPSRTPGVAPAASVLASGLTNPHGLAFDGSTLFVAESDQVDRYRYERSGALGDHTIVVADLPDASTPGLTGYEHYLKTVIVGPRHQLYISVGSTGNTTADDRSATPERASILRTSENGGERTVYAEGIRNGTGLAIDPDGQVWSAVNNRDDIGYPFHQDYDGDGIDDYGKVITAYTNNHPTEELAKLTPGRDLGWPYCNPDPDVTPGSPTTAFNMAFPPFDNDVQTNPGGAVFNCATLAPVDRGIPAHSAPLGMNFLSRSQLGDAMATGALVAVHGSWDRQPPQAPAVLYFPWNRRTRELGAEQTLVGGFQNADGTRWGRPVDAVSGPDHAIYVTDDYSGTIYRFQPADTGEPQR